MFNIILIFILLIISSCSSKISNVDKISNKIFSEYIPKIKKKLHPAGLGGGEKNGKISLIDVTFTIEETLNIKKARELIIDASCSLLNIINKNPEYYSYFESSNPLHNIHIAIIGKDNKIKDLDFVQFVLLINGRIYYKVKAEKPQFPPLVSIHEELFEEAEKIIQAKEFVNQDLN